MGGSYRVLSWPRKGNLKIHSDLTRPLLWTQKPGNGQLGGILWPAVSLSTGRRAGAAEGDDEEGEEGSI